MKLTRIPLFLLTLCLAVFGFARTTSAQMGAIEFNVQLTPANGNSEPVRGLPFYVLKKSFEDIRREAEAANPAPDMDAFIDQQMVTPELKAWMKRNHTVSLTGDDFLHNLTAKDVMDVPEFFDAYVGKNSKDGSDDFPKIKYKEKDKKKNPERYAAQRKEYLDGIQKFIHDHPETLRGMDVELNTINPEQGWMMYTSKREPAIRRETMELARGRYMVAEADTDLRGHGSISGLVAGSYWLGTLDIFATVGDARVQWDIPVTVRPGQTTRVALNNSNAAEPVAANR